MGRLDHAAKHLCFWNRLYLEMDYVYVTPVRPPPTDTGDPESSPDVSDVVYEMQPERRVVDGAKESHSEIQKSTEEDIDRSELLATQLIPLGFEHCDCIRIARNGMLAGVLLGVAAGIAGTQLLSRLWR